MKYEKIKSAETKEKLKPSIKIEKRDGEISRKTSFEYNKQGKVTKEISELGKSGRGKITEEYTYDKLGRVAATNFIFEGIMPSGNKRVSKGEYGASYEGDSLNPSLESYSRNGSITEIKENKYDERGRLVEREISSFPDGKESTKKEKFFYDEKGRLIEKQELNPNGPESSYFFRNKHDVQGRLIKEERGIIGSNRPFGVIEHEYEEGGKLETATNYYGTEVKEKIWRTKSRFNDNGDEIEFEHVAYSDNKQNRTSKTVYEYIYGK